MRHIKTRAGKDQPVYPISMSDKCIQGISKNRLCCRCFFSGIHWPTLWASAGNFSVFDNKWPSGCCYINL